MPYIDNLWFEKLRRLVAHSSRYVIEGVNLLDTVHRLGLELDCLVYVKRVASSSEWLDEDECTQSAETMDTYSAGCPPLDAELIRYHATHRPWTRADYIFRRVDDSE